MSSTDTKRKNNKGKKSSLFMCFKPVAIDNSFKHKRRKHKTTDQVVTYFAVDEEKEGGASVLAAADDGGESHRRENGRDRWQALRAVLNETPLMKKMISRMKSNKDYLSRSNSNLKEEVSGDISNSQSKSINRTDSNTFSSFGRSSAIFTSSSLTSSSSSRTDHTSGSSPHESGIEVTNQNQYGVEDRRREGYYGSNTSLCMFLISLLVLIMWGKFFATLYTSIWFYLLPPRRIRPCNEEDRSGASEFDSVDQYKKKVIRERTG